jgi:hypothetical protein
LKDETKSIFAADKKLQFLLLCLATVLLAYSRQALIDNETAAFEFLQDRPEGFILRILNALELIGIPIIYAWKFTVIGFVIWVGCFMFGYRVTYSQCWGIAVGAEFIFLLADLVKILWFVLIETDPTLSQVNAFYPLSLIQLVDYYAIDKRFAYPLRALNVFEVLYWFALVNRIHFIARKNKKMVWWIVSCSYILIFLLWLVFYIIVYK